jgi:hypothetical protein
VYDQQHVGSTYFIDAQASDAYVGDASFSGSGIEDDGSTDADFAGEEDGNHE